MFSRTKSVAVLTKAFTVAALGTVAMFGVNSGIASAGGTGNTVNNCYGVYFNTDWNQNCGAGGASQAGWYYSTGDCTGSADKNVSRNRAKGNATSVDGPDCAFQVINVRTTYGG
ncbi:hypothetical protein [Streptosporangium sp. NPDC002524]|uniref:hypothetical protein n=1 Tax=Streptosporangium sp. NPDC002524 TaxID=3154537 RepID=UPI00333464CA